MKLKKPIGSSSNGNHCNIGSTINKKFKEDLSRENASMEHIFQSQRLCQELGVLNNSKIEDLGQQLRGIDFMRRDGGVCKAVDAKFIAAPFETFCFELQGVEHEDRPSQVGWLINKNLLTDEYLILIHELKNGSHNYWKDKYLLNNPDDILSTYALLIDKNKLISFIEEETGNIALEALTEKIKEMGKEIEPTLPDSLKKSTMNFLLEDGQLKYVPASKFESMKKVWKSSKEDARWPKQYEAWPNLIFSYCLGQVERPIIVRLSQAAMRSVADKEFYPEDIEGTINSGVRVDEYDALRISEIIGDASLLNMGEITIKLKKKEDY